MTVGGLICWCGVRWLVISATKSRAIGRTPGRPSPTCVQYVAHLPCYNTLPSYNIYQWTQLSVALFFPVCVLLGIVKCLSWWSGMTDWFSVRSGVRQGSILSPNLFTAFMNIFILSIRNRDLGCYVNRSLVSCILYADDVILLSASLTVLQEMLHIVHLTASVWFYEKEINE